MRAAGGVMLALGALLVAVRREHSWTEFELFLVFAAPAAALLALAVGDAESAAHDRAESWRGVLLVLAVLLSLVALFQFLAWVGADTRHLLYDAAVLAVTALIAAVGARRVRAPYVMLLASFALLGAWMLVWIKIFPDPSPNTVRWLLLGGGLALLLASALADLAGTTGSGEIATAGALGVVAAGILGVFVSAFGALFAGFATIASGHTGHEQIVGAHEGVFPAVFGGHLSGSQTTGWDVYLLVVSLALIVAGARTRRRGPGYVGALGIILFFASTAAQLVRVSGGHAPSHSLLGWPLVLLLLGLAGLAAPLLRRREP
jgi:hypothetical protein